jgi:hypothetical protein
MKNKYRIIKDGDFWWAEKRNCLIWFLVKDTMTRISAEECELMLLEKLNIERRVIKKLTL